MPPDIEYSAELNDKQILAALRRIETGLKEVSETGQRSFDTVQKGSKLSGVQIGAVAGAAGELTRRFIDLGVRAVEVFGQIAAGGVKLNKDFELTRIALTNIFSGNQQAADAFLDSIDETAALLGTSRQELRTLGKSILPDVGNIQDTVDILKQAIVLGRDAGQNITGIRIALEEALASGGERAGLLSLRRRLNIPPATIDRLVDLSKEIGIGAALAQVLGERVEKAGISADAFTDTFAVGLGRVQAELLDLQQLFGQPIFEQLKEELSETLAVFEENQGDIETTVEAFGDLAARVAEIVGTGLRELIENIDFENLEGLADDFTELFNTGEALVKVLTGPDTFNDWVDGSRSLLDNLTEALEVIVKIAALGRAFVAEFDARQEIFNRDAGKLTRGGPLAEIFASDEVRQEADIAGEKARNAVLQDAVDSLKTLGEENEKLKDKQAERRQETEKSTEADIAAGEAELKRKQAIEALQAAELAQKEIDQERAELEEELQKKLTNIARKQQRRREDDAIKNGEKLEDIARKQNERIEDAALDLTRAEQDLAKKQAEERIDIQRDLSRERRDIEAETAEEIRRIRERASFDAAEAERTNDAQRFLEIKRQEAQQIKEAQSNRDTDLKDAEQKARDETADLKEQQRQQLEAIQTKNRRALEDLSTRLERELEAQRIAEERQAAERQRQEARELADFRRLEAEKQRALEESLAAQFELVKKAAEAQAALQIQVATGTAAKIAEIYNSVHRGGSDPDNPFGTPFSDYSNTRNQSMINQPTNPVYLPTITKSTTNSPTFNLSESIFNDPVARAQLKGIVLETMGEINA